jgi:lipopolysaccharide assembly protein A
LTKEPEPTPATAAGALPRPEASPMPHHRLKRTRAGGLWVTVVCFAVILLLLLIFILQNGATVDVAYLGAHAHLPLGVAMLLAAVGGVLLVVLAGAARISQLRATAKRHRRADAERAAAAARAPDVPAG